MIKYELRKATAEIPVKYKSKIKEGITQNSDILGDIDSSLIKRFDSKDEAVLEFQNKKYHTTIYHQDNLYWIEEYFIQENHYDTDGEWEMDEGSGDIWEITPMPEFE